MIYLLVNCTGSNGQVRQDADKIKENDTSDASTAFIEKVINMLEGLKNLEFGTEPRKPVKPKVPPLEDFYYVMPEARQKYILKKVPQVKFGMTMSEVITFLGEPNDIQYSTEDGMVLDSENYAILDTITVHYYFRRYNKLIPNNVDKRITLFFNKEKRLSDIMSNIRGVSRGPHGDTWEKDMEEYGLIPWELDE